MAQQEEGWPLGLQPLTVRVGLGRHQDFSGSISFNTLLTGSPSSSSTDSSSDLDTESTGSFFHDRSITLGSLIGVSSIFELSKRSVRVKRAENLKVKRNQKPKTCLFSLCSRDSTDAESVNNNPPSLGHFLAVERRAATECRRRDSPIFYGLDELTRPGSESNSLFVNGCVAPPPASPWGANRGLEDGNGYGVPMLLSCMCGQATH